MSSAQSFQKSGAGAAESSTTSAKNILSELRYKHCMELKV